MPNPRSEFEGQPGKTPGLKPSGIFGNWRPWERLRLLYRTEQDPDDATVDLNAKADKWRHGGIPEQVRDKDRWWEI